MRPIEEIACGLWPTASASGFEAKDPVRLMERRQECKERHGNGNGFGLTLGQMACLEAAAMWPTPCAVDRVRSDETMAKCAEFRKRNAGQNTVPLYLGEVAMRTALWPTPMAHEARLGYQRRMGDAKGSHQSLTTEATDALGLGENVTGLQEQTEKRGALNPEFVCWLMGFPPEWDACAPTAMPSSRKSRQK
jgi:hypothetical protein